MMYFTALIGTLAVLSPLTGTLVPDPPCVVAGPDADQDGLSDDCEAVLLERFAPTLVASARGCNWDPAAGRLAGGYLVAAEPIDSGVRLAYLPAYFDDCGWSGPKCLLRLRGGCDPHDGDSEAIFIDIAQNPSTGQWHPQRLFLSAHCFGRSDGRCRWYATDEVQWLGNTSLIWVAEGKNANYPSQGACDSGHWGYDTCDRNDRGYRFPVDSARRNVGSFSKPLPREEEGCISWPSVNALPSRDGSECVWTDPTFRGWSGHDGGGATGYRRYLRDIAGFMPAGTAGPRAQPDVIS